MGENIETFIAQLGSIKQNWGVSAPIHLSTTYSHPKFGQSTGLIIPERKIQLVLF